MRLDEGDVRPQWAPFVDRLELLPADTLQRRARYVRESIEADGVTYTVYEDPTGLKRPWQLDLLPLIIDAGEWDSLSEALAQRAHLLNLILADLYGPQQLIADGLIPPALIYGQLGFKRPCRGIVPPGGIFLHHHAADLARAPDGRWWVLATAPRSSGAGYALQNRIILSRTFPDSFRELQVRTLASFFRASQDTLSRLAPTEGGEARWRSC